MFKTMDAATIRSIIEDEVDIITPAIDMESEVLKHARCPVCGSVGAGRAILPPKIVVGESGVQIFRTPFSDSSPIITSHAKCRNCDTEFSPRTGVIIKQDEPVLTDPNFPHE